MKFFCLALILSFLILSTSAQEKKNGVLFEINEYKFPFNLQRADAVYKLPDKLNEISGLSYYKKNKLATLQDEKGNIYFFNLNSGKISKKIDFSGDGDYEGIEVVDEQIWVLKSNGDLFKVNHSKKDKTVKVKEYKTDLSTINDAEGLAFDKKNNRLLIACKGFPYIEDKKKGKSKKGIYSFSLNEKTLSKEPFIIIDLDEIKELKQYNTMAKLGVNLMSHLNPSKGDGSFQPSGIAIHPQTQHLFLLSSVGKLLLVCNNDGKIIAIVELNPSLFLQPEGICFDSGGTLYISNEGRESVATILAFQPK
jgi:uncharacterized protein YjiK